MQVNVAHLERKLTRVFVKPTTMEKGEDIPDGLRLDDWIKGCRTIASIS
jgi:hypothetical protein